MTAHLADAGQAARIIAEQVRKAGGQVQAPKIAEARKHLADSLETTARHLDLAPEAQRDYDRVMKEAEHLPPEYRVKVARGLAQRMKADADAAAQQTASMAQVVQDTLLLEALPKIPKGTTDAAIDRAERELRMVLDAIPVADEHDLANLTTRARKYVEERGADSVHVALLAGTFGRLYLEARGIMDSEEWHEGIREHAIRAAAQVSGPQGDAARVLRDATADGSLFGQAAYMATHVDALFRSHCRPAVLEGEAVVPGERPGDPVVYAASPGREYVRGSDGRVLDPISGTTH